MSKNTSKPDYSFGFFSLVSFLWAKPNSLLEFQQQFVASITTPTITNVSGASQILLELALLILQMELVRISMF
jgi:hypothetical protein